MARPSYRYRLTWEVLDYKSEVEGAKGLSEVFGISEAYAKQLMWSREELTFRGVRIERVAA